MPNTFELIASSTVGSGGSAGFTFSSIPSTYTDLKLVLSARSNAAATNDNVSIYLNGSSASLSGKQIYGDGSSAFSGGDGGYGSKAAIPAANATSNTFGNAEWYIPNYTSSNYKSFSNDSVMENNATLSYSNLWASLWSNTSAVTSIQLYINAGSFVQYTTAYLYGVKNA